MVGPSTSREAVSLIFSTDGKDSMYCLLACICTATLKQTVTLALKSEVVRTQCTACLPVFVQLHLNRPQLLPSESEVLPHENHLQLLTRSGWYSLLTESSVWYFWYTLIPSFTVSSLISIMSWSPFSLPRRRLPPARRRSYGTKRGRGM